MERLSSLNAIDAELATGPDRIVLVTNAGVSLRSKSTGAELAFKELDDDFFTRASTSPFSVIADPDVIYDQRSDRFWIVAVQPDFTWVSEPCSPNCVPVRGWMHVAVSATSSPSDLGDDWTQFLIDIQGSPNGGAFEGIAHFLNIATDDDYLYVSCTDSVNQVFGNPDWRTTVLILEKAPMLDEVPSAPDLEWVHLHNVSPSWGYAIGTRDTDAASSGVMYLIGPQINPSPEDTEHLHTRLDIIAIYREGDAWVVEPFISSGTRQQGIALPQPHFNRKSKVWDPSRCGNMSNEPCVSVVVSACVHAVLHDDGKDATLWTTFHCREFIDEKTPGDYNIVRWFEFSLNGWPFEKLQEPTLRQWGEINKSGQSPPWECYDPSIAVNSRGDMALTWTESGASQSSPAQYTRMMRGLRCAGDTLGTLPDIAVVEDSQYGVPTPLFKIDYSGTSMDPTDDDRFWGHSPLVKAPGSPPATHWETWLAEYALDCGESKQRWTWPNPRCYADCDTQSGPGVLDIFDFLCFGNRFSAGDPYACDCDTSTGMGVCDIFDFLCFGNEFNAGCP